MQSDTELTRNLLVTSSLIYVVLHYLLPRSQIPVLVTVFYFTSMVGKLAIFKRLVGGLAPFFGTPATWRTQWTPVLTNIPKTIGSGHLKFLALSEDSRVELLQAIKTLQSYTISSKKVNDRRRRLFKLMTWRQQRLCEDVGYLNKLKRIDKSILANQDLFNKIVEFSIQKYGIAFLDFNLLSKNTATQTSATNYRVIEALGHFTRDWDNHHEAEPLLKYIKKQLDSLPKDGKTCIIIPGSGLGRIAHEIANYGDYDVHAVEYSGLMHLCNEFIYAEPYKKEFYPYIHTCSNFYDTESQFRSSKLKQTSLPANLTLHIDDFRYFEVPNKEKYTNVVVLSVFFIDTAENFIDYLDRIQKLTVPHPKNNPIKNGYWINIGPLKYGSAAQVELNASEIQQIRAETGWKDFDVAKSLELDEKLVGYVTDKESMWQGYYGLSMWGSERKENKANIKREPSNIGEKTEQSRGKREN